MAGQRKGRYRLFSHATPSSYLRQAPVVMGPGVRRDDERVRLSNSHTVIASAAKQSIAQQKERMDCFAALAMTLI
jgi:hypothetical protein